MSKKELKIVSKKEARKNLENLVGQFDSHITQYKDSKYNEATLRIDFLNKFFNEVLGWDVRNNANLPPSFREVITEGNVEVEGRSKSPDYSFRKKNGVRLFFVEAKKPHVNINTHKDSAFQLRRYGWSADLPISVLSSFEYLAVYDCSVKPTKGERPSIARLKIIKYDDYLNEFDYIWNNFSKEAVQNGSLKKYEDNKRTKKGSASVDKDFLTTLDDWRIHLAKDVSTNNNLNEDELNYVVQVLIDRLIFLRIAEDRNVENYGTLREASKSDGVYASLFTYFQRTDQKFNSGLFAENKLFNDLKIADTVIREILNGLYFPICPYEFSVIPIEILGKAYEQFLGKKIILSDNGKIVIEDKPSVRKAGGVYYTPRYIVEFMVNQTLGKALEGKSVEDVSKLHVLDPASGSGSFLICAYEHLLNWHKDYFTNNKNKVSKKVLKEIITPEGELTTKFKGKILLNNIYGVDVDASAVEVTKLSLLLKCLEGETKETVQAQIQLFHERVLPTLDENIKCGNSLIDFDIFVKFPDLNEDIRLKRKINPFNWKLGFKETFENGGFDVVIGNPPYIFTREQFADIEKDYYTQNYHDSWEKINTYFLFMEKVISLSKPEGLASFIVPNSWLTAESGKLTRDKYIPILCELVDMNYCAFDGVQMEPTIFVSSPGKDTPLVKVTKVSNEDDFRKLNYFEYSSTEWVNNEGRINVPESSECEDVLKKIWNNSVKLKERFQVFTGLQAYEKGKGNPTQTQEDVKNRIYDYDYAFDDDTHMYLNGKDISRFSFNWSKTFLRYGRWLSQPRSIEIFNRSRVLVREITSKFPTCVFASYFDKLYLNNKSILNVLHENNDKDELRILESVLNSEMISFFYKNKGVKSSRKLFPKIVVRNLREFPYPNTIRSEDRSEILNINGALRNLYSQSPSTKAAKAQLEQRIKFEEDRLNTLIYKLFGISEEQQKIIRQGVS